MKSFMEWLCARFPRLNADYDFDSPKDFEKWKAEQRQEYERLCRSCGKAPGTHSHPDGGSGAVCEDCAR